MSNPTPDRSSPPQRPVSEAGETNPAKPLYRRFEVLILAGVVVLGCLMWLFSGSSSKSSPTPAAPAVATPAIPPNLTDDQAFVYREYLDTLGRPATSLELSADSAALSGKGRPQYVQNLFHSSEFLDQPIFLGTCYIAILEREPDYDGWTFWLNHLHHAEGASKNGVILTLLDSQEYQMKHSSRDATTQYKQMYAALYGKPIAKVPLSANRGDLLRGLLTSADVPAATWKRLFGYYLFFTQLRRQPTLLEALRYKNMGGDAGKELEAISEILKSPEYQKRTFR